MNVKLPSNIIEKLKKVQDEEDINANQEEINALKV